MLIRILVLLIYADACGVALALVPRLSSGKNAEPASAAHRSFRMPAKAQKRPHGSANPGLVRHEAALGKRRKSLAVTAGTPDEDAEPRVFRFSNSREHQRGQHLSRPRRGGESSRSSDADPHNICVVLDGLSKTWSAPLRRQAGLALVGGCAGQQALQALSPATKKHGTRETVGELSDRNHRSSCGLLELWAFCVHLARGGEDPRNVLQPVGLKLIGELIMALFDGGFDFLDKRRAHRGSVD